MDPIYVWAKRDSSTAHSLAYDQQFVYQREGFKPKLAFSRVESKVVYASTELIDFYTAQKRELYVPSREIAVFERANPFSSVPRILAESKITSDSADMRSLSEVFGLDDNTLMITLSGATIGSQISNFIVEYLLDDELPTNFVIGVDNMLTEISLHFAYILSKLYHRITLLQPAISSQRYLICMGFAGFGLLLRQDLSLIVSQNKANPLVKMFEAVPSPFVEWLTLVNNVHLGIASEILANTIESKKAFDRGERYFPGVSYDIKRVVNLLSDLPVEPVVLRPRFLKLSKQTDEKFVFGLHLFGEPEDFSGGVSSRNQPGSSATTGRPLHRTLNVEADEKMEYEPSQDIQRGGIHWGQRKLLMAEVDFLSQNSIPGEKSIAFYIGAAPFEHGSVLAQWFPNVNFWLCDPRGDQWSKKITHLITDGRVITTTAWFDLEFAQQICKLLDCTGKSSGQLPSSDTLKEVAMYLNQRGTETSEVALGDFIKGVKSFFFLSDIRSTDPSLVGNVQHELSVHDDMQLQKEAAEILSAAIPPEIKFMSSLKFRLPFIPEIGSPDYLYGKGSLHTQVWSRMSSTELRLWWNPKDGLQTYNKIAVEQIMMHHNTVLRSARFGKLLVPGYCECHDCHYEVQVISEYLLKFHSNVRDPIGQVSTYVDMMKDCFGRTLEAKSTGLRTDDQKLRRLDKFSPRKELDRAALYYRTRASLMAASNATEEQVDTFSLYRLFTNAPADSERAVLAWSQIANIQIKQAEDTLRSYASTLKTEREKMEARWASSKDAPEPRLEISKIGRAVQKKADDKGFYHISAILPGASDAPGKKVSTIGFHKDILRRVLIKMERFYDLTDRDLREDHVVLMRAFAILKRFGTVWSDHFALSLDPIYALNEELPGMLNGGSIFSTPEVSEGLLNANYTAVYPDIELDFAQHTTVFSLDPNRRIIPSNYVTVFYPDIEPLWREVADLWKDVLRKRSKDQPLTVVFLVPAHLDSLVIADTPGLFKSRNEYKGRVFNVLKNAEVMLPVPHNVIVLATPGSTFEIKL